MRSFISLLACLVAVARAADLSHDPAGRLVSEQYTNGAAVAYGYDAAGNVTRVAMASPSNATPADVSVHISTAPAAPAAGTAFTTTVTAANAGPGTAFGVTVTWNHAASLQVEAIGLSQGWVTPSATAAFFAFGAVPSGGMAVAEIVARHPAQGAATGTFAVASYAADAVPANNAATQALAVAAGADLRLAGSSFPDVVCGGLPLTYFIAVTNAGPDSASAVTATNVLSGAFTLSAVLMSQGTSSSNGQSVALNFGALAAGAAATAQVWLRPVQTNGWLTNVCTVAGAQADPDRADNVVMLVNTVRAATVVVTTAADSGAGSLRAAMTGRSAATYVAFDIPGTNVPSIHLLSPLPTNAYCTIDGFSQWARRVEIDGSGAGGTETDGIRVMEPGNVMLRGLVVNRFPRHGIHLEKDFAELQDFAVEGCRIGTDATGMLAGYGNGSNGVLVTKAGYGRIGGTEPWQANLISGNGAAGLMLGAEIVAVDVQGNRIGTDLAGATALSNGADGVAYLPTSAATDGVALRGNLISGNRGFGVRIAGRNLVVQGNLIGTDGLGASAIGNASGGVYLATGAGSVTYNQIGGSAAGEGNLISGNGGHGILGIRGTAENAYDWIAGNLIGTDLSGLVALPNAGDGVRLIGGYYAQIGDVAAGAANVIGGNTGHGVHSISGRYVNVWGNLVGVGADGSTVVANQGHGVMLDSPQNSEVGGVYLDRCNVIAGNLGHGVALTTSVTAVNTVIGNRIGFTDAAGGDPAPNHGAGVAVLGGGYFDLSANAIAHNLGLGIDLGVDGVSANDGAGDADGGANFLMNFPAIGGVTGGAGTTVVSGTLVGRTNGTARLEFFGSATADPTGYGEGAAYLGAATVALDPSGTTPFSVSLPGNLAAGTEVTATATILNNTSEFSPAFRFAPGDSDGDGIPDDWENRWGLGLGALTRTGDRDADGAPDLDEYVADTCPTNVADRLRIQSVWTVTNTAHVTFGSSTSRVYALQGLTNLAAGGWAGLPGQIGRSGQPGGATTLLDTNAAKVRIYRIHVSVP